MALGLIVPQSILLVSGSLRRASSNTAALRTAAHIAPPDTACFLYEGIGRIPAFNPDDDHEPLPDEVRRWRQVIHGSEAVVFSTPEYAGALPGSLKNLLDWTIGDDQPGSIYEKPVGWVNVSTRGAEGAHRELRTVLTYAHARVVESACIHLPVVPTMVGDDGMIHDDAARAALMAVLTDLASVTPTLDGAAP